MYPFLGEFTSRTLLLVEFFTRLINNGTLGNSNSPVVQHTNNRRLDLNKETALNLDQTLPTAPIPRPQEPELLEVIDFSDRNRVHFNVDRLQEIFSYNRDNQISVEITYSKKSDPDGRISFKAIVTDCRFIPFSGLKEYYTLTNFKFKNHEPVSLIAGPDFLPAINNKGNLIKLRVFSDSSFNDKELPLGGLSPRESWERKRIPHLEYIGSQYLPEADFIETKRRVQFSFVDFRGAGLFYKKDFDKFVGKIAEIIFRPHETFGIIGLDEYSRVKHDEYEPEISRSPEFSAFKTIKGIILSMDLAVCGPGPEVFHVVTVCIEERDKNNYSKDAKTLQFTTGKFSNAIEGTSQLIAIGRA